MLNRNNDAQMFLLQIETPINTASVHHRTRKSPNHNINRNYNIMNISWQYQNIKQHLSLNVKVNNLYCNCMSTIKLAGQIMKCTCTAGLSDNTFWYMCLSFDY